MSKRKSPKNKRISENWGRCGTNLSSLVRSATLVTHNSAISRQMSSAIVPLESHDFFLAFKLNHLWLYGAHLRSSTDSRRFLYVRTVKEEISLFFCSTKMAFPDGTGAGKLSRWTTIITVSEPKKIGA